MMNHSCFWTLCEFSILFLLSDFLSFLFCIFLLLRRACIYIYICLLRLNLDIFEDLL